LMAESQKWDWGPGKKEICDIAALRKQYQSVHEPVASPDGETIAAPVVLGDGAYSAVVNGQCWPGTFEKLWYLRFGPNGRLVALVRINDEWTLAVEGQPWEERFEYACSSVTICMGWWWTESPGNKPFPRYASFV
jgi:hypothetical protein